MQVHFKLNYTVRGLYLKEGTTYRFEYQQAHHPVVTLRPPSSDERTGGHQPDNAFCSTICTTEPGNSVLLVFEQIARNDVLPVDTPDLDIGQRYPTPEGLTIRIPSLSDFKDPFRQFVKKIHSELSDIARRTVATLRWRSNEIGTPRDPISTSGFAWSFDGIFWHPAPCDTGVRAIHQTVIKLSDEALTAVTEIVDSGKTEPLHHELLREAWVQMDQNPRSAIIVGMAAAEIAMKRCIGELVPSAEWLATNLPSPPLEKILREYLPSLPAKHTLNGKVKSPPEDILASLKKGVTIRNKIVHAGYKSPAYETVEEILWAVRDLLYLTDYYSGAQWALANVREVSLNKLNEQH